MKRTTRRPRTAHILFRKDTPFKPKVVKSKKVYSRKVKHRGEAHG